MSDRTQEQILGEALIKMGVILESAGKELQKLPGHPSIWIPPSPPAIEATSQSSPSPPKTAPSQSTTQLVIDRVGHWTGMPDGWAEAKSRKAGHAEARWLCWHILRELTTMSTPELGKIFRPWYDHSTVLNGLSRINQRVQQNPRRFPWLNQVMEEVRRQAQCKPLR